MFGIFRKPRPIDENILAMCVADREGKKHELPIGQIKEVQKILLDLLANENWRAVKALLRKHRKGN